MSSTTSTSDMSSYTESIQIKFKILDIAQIVSFVIIRDLIEKSATHPPFTTILFTIITLSNLKISAGKIK